MSKRMSERQFAANRRNAQKSTGPVTPEGKRASRANAIKHALTSTVCVLSTESTKDFLDLINAYADQFEPSNQFEAHLLADIVAVHWNMRRVRFIETGIFEVEYQKPGLLENCNEVTPGAKTILAYTKLCTTNLFTLANRQLARLSREFTRLMKLFNDTRQSNPPAAEPPAESGPIQKQTNEPIPVSEQANEPQNILANLAQNVFRLILVDQEKIPPLVSAA